MCCKDFIVCILLCLTVSVVQRLRRLQPDAVEEVVIREARVQILEYNLFTCACDFTRPRNDLLCVEWDVKPYTLTHL